MKPAESTPTTVSIDDGPADSTGRTIRIVELANPWLTIRMLSLGATMWQLYPTGGQPSDSLCLSFPEPTDYETNKPYFGSFVGPVSNRIANARFVLDGVDHQLEANEGPNHLHGGPTGFSTRHWDVTIDPDTGTVRFRLDRGDGDGGYPGNLSVTAEWTLEGTTVTNRWRATTDRATPVSLTNHNYWNLNGDPTVLNHVVTIPSATTIELGDDLIPTGILLPVDGTDLDLRQPRPVSALASVEKRTGIDRTYLIDEKAVTTLRTGDGSRSLAITTSLPGMQFYTGQYLEGGAAFGGYGPCSGLCLETQHLPDAINHPNFPTPVVHPDNPVSHTTSWEFTLD